MTIMGRAALRFARGMSITRYQHTHLVVERTARQIGRLVDSLLAELHAPNAYVERVLQGVRKADLPDYYIPSIVQQRAVPQRDAQERAIQRSGELFTLAVANKGDRQWGGDYEKA
jgi:hypothetical protein